jgi:para-nitrobenzyl esterase
MQKIKLHFIVLFPLMILFFSAIITSCYEAGDNSSKLPILASESNSSGTGGSSGGASGSGPIRTTLYGPVQGTTDEETTWAWLGIPYAKPPVGALRWRAPQNPDSWSGTRKAEAFCSICPQYGNQITETGRDTFVSIWGKGVPVGKEDCLYLNIWRPQSEEKLPVFVFIHGGANYIGASNVSIYRGARLASRQKMVVVTINYRIGPFGWFTLPALKNGNPLDDSGNYGTLDIIKALEWIKNNISSFGGDPGNVTISGQSAGGWNVTSMLVSPLAKGLFHRAIIMSGWPFSFPMSMGEAYSNAVMYRFLVRDDLADNVFEAASLLKEKGNAWTAEYLRSMTVADFFPPGLAGPLGLSMDGGPLSIFRSGIYEDGTVIPKSVLSCLSSGNYNKVPIILGCMTEEMKLFLPYILANPGTMWDVFQQYDPDNPEATFKLKDMLDPILWILLPSYEPLGKMGQLIFQSFGVDNTAKVLRGHQDDVYAYKFAWNDEPYPFDFFVGAAHAMDLPFVFGNFIRDKSSLVSFSWSNQNIWGCEELSNAVMTYYAQFARTGNPNKPGSSLPEWTPWSNDKGAFKRIVFDAGTVYMSDDYTEPSEAINVQEIITEIIKLISNN